MESLRRRLSPSLFLVCCVNIQRVCLTRVYALVRVLVILEREPVSGTTATSRTSNGITQVD